MAFCGTRNQVTHERDHAQDCEQASEEANVPICALRPNIEVLGDDLTAEQHARINEIAGKCLFIARSKDNRIFIPTWKLLPDQTDPTKIEQITFNCRHIGCNL